MSPLLANRNEVSMPKLKREAIAALLQENPQRSDRAIAKQAKVNRHMVAKVRTEMKATGRTGQSAQSAVPGGQVGLDGKVRKVSRGKVRADGEFSHKDDGRTEVFTRPAAGNQSPQRLSEMRAAASSAARENPRRAPRR